MMQEKTDNGSFQSNSDHKFSLLQDDKQPVPMITNNILSSGSRSLSISNDIITGNTPSARRRKKFIRTVIILILLGFIIYVPIDSLTTKHLNKSSIVVLQWIVKHPFIGFGVAVVLIALGAVLCLPHVLFALGYGYIFGSTFGMVKGVTIATCATFLGTSIGALLAFILGRYLFRDSAESLMVKYPVFRALDKVMEGNGFKIILLLRLSPMPINILDYMAGMTSVPMRDYALALIALVPNSAVLSFIGASAKSLTKAVESSESNFDKGLTIAMITSAVVFTLLSLGITSYYAKIELDKILKKDEEDITAGDEEDDQLPVFSAQST